MNPINASDHEKNLIYFKYELCNLNYFTAQDINSFTLERSVTCASYDNADVKIRLVFQN